jgi:hypothetical protein
MPRAFTGVGGQEPPYAAKGKRLFTVGAKTPTAKRERRE